MLFIKKKKKIFNISLFLTNLKFKNMVIYIKGFYGVKTLFFKFNNYINLNLLKERFKNI